MKKALSVFLALLLLISLAGCGVKGALTAAQEENAAAQAKNSALTEENAYLAEKVESLGRGQEYLKDKISGLESEISSLERDLLESNLEISSLERQVEAGKYTFSDGYFSVGSQIIEPEHRLWLSTEATAVYQHYAGAEPYYSLDADGVLEAYAAVHLDEGFDTPEETWLLVHHCSFDAGYLPLVWVRQSQCTPYTDANREDARWPVYVRNGAEITPNDGVPSDGFGINSIENGVAFIFQHGGWTGTTPAENLIYPDPAVFSYMGE